MSNEKLTNPAQCMKAVFGTIKAHRRRCLFFLLAFIMLSAGVVALLIAAIRQSIESIVKQSYIDWDFVRLDEFTPNTLHIFAIGRFENSGIHGTLEATEFDMMNPSGSSGLVGKLQLPDVVLGNTPDNTFSVDQSIIFQDKSANLQFFTGLGRPLARLLLQGSGTFRWRNLRTPVRLNRVESRLPSLSGSIKYSPANAFCLATSPQNDSITFAANISVRNLSPLSVSIVSHCWSH